MAVNKKVNNKSKVKVKKKISKKRARRVAMVQTYYGKKTSAYPGLPRGRLEFGHKRDHSEIYLGDGGTGFRMSQDEAIELMGLLINLYPLDAIGQV